MTASTGTCARRGWTRHLLFALYLVVATAIGLEILLRLFPSAIPIRMLRLFDDELRVEIAQRLGLPTRVAVREVPRDDGGPPLYLSLPHVKFPLFGSEEGGANVAMDDRGFCNPPGTGTPPIDVITVGGSISWCVLIPAEETWTARLAPMLQLRTYNMTIPGTGPYEYLQVLKQMAVPLHPRVVIFDFSEGNDLRDVVAYERYRADHTVEDTDGEGQALLHSSSQSGLLARHSYLVALIRAQLIRLHGEHNGTRLAKVPGVPDKGKINFRFRVRWGDREVAFNPESRDQDEAYHALAWRQGAIKLESLRAPLEQLVALGRQYGFRPILTYTPADYTVYRQFIEWEDPSLAEPMRVFDEAQRKYLLDTAAELGLDAIDLTEPLQQAAATLQDRELLFFARALHLSSAGQRVIAEYLAGRLPALMPR
jgi:hypothetical protein